ncbi:MAG: T9SS type A sorting domain-containing protein, partial [Bacteroidia bacterium]|nr:T9SS type A sorting domain-containing protein [Bacteroidia bacterium]
YYPFSGLNDVKQNISSTITLFPNPTDGNLTIQNRLQTWITSVAMYNQSGVLCYSQEINSNSSQITLNVTELKPGIYFARISTPNGEIVKKIIKQ